MTAKNGPQFTVTIRDHALAKKLMDSPVRPDKANGMIHVTIPGVGSPNMAVQWPIDPGAWNQQGDPNKQPPKPAGGGKETA